MKIMNRIKITKNRVVACFAAILLLLPATVERHQHFDAHIAGRKVTLQECFDLAARQNLQMQAEEVGRAYAGDARHGLGTG